METLGFIKFIYFNLCVTQVNSQNVRFLFDGDRILESHTPADVKTIIIRFLYSYDWNYLINEYQI